MSHYDYGNIEVGMFLLKWKITDNDVPNFTCILEVL